MSSGVVSYSSPMVSDVTNLRPWIGGTFIYGKVRSVCTIATLMLGGWRADGTVLVCLVILTKSASAMVTLRPWHGGMFLLGESQATCTIALPPSWVLGSGGAEIVFLASVARSRYLGRRSLMSMSVIVKYFVECWFLRYPWRRLIYTQTKNCDHSFFSPRAFFAHINFLRKILLANFTRVVHFYYFWKAVLSKLLCFQNIDLFCPHYVSLEVLYLVYIH